MQESVACLFLNNNENDALLTWSSWVRILLVAVTPQIDSLRKGRVVSCDQRNSVFDVRQKCPYLIHEVIETVSIRGDLYLRPSFLFLDVNA